MYRGISGRQHIPSDGRVLSGSFFDQSHVSGAARLRTNSKAANDDDEAPMAARRSATIESVKSLEPALEYKVDSLFFLKRAYPASKKSFSENQREKSLLLNTEHARASESKGHLGKIACICR